MHEDGRHMAQLQLPKPLCTQRRRWKLGDRLAESRCGQGLGVVLVGWGWANCSQLTALSRTKWPLRAGTARQCADTYISFGRTRSWC